MIISKWISYTRYFFLKLRCQLDLRKFHPIQESLDSPPEFDLCIHAAKFPVKVQDWADCYRSGEHIDNDSNLEREAGLFCFAKCRGKSSRKPSSFQLFLFAPKSRIEA